MLVIPPIGSAESYKRSYCNWVGLGESYSSIIMVKKHRSTCWHNRTICRMFIDDNNSTSEQLQWVLAKGCRANLTMAGRLFQNLIAVWFDKSFDRFNDRFDESFDAFHKSFDRFRKSFDRTYKVIYWTYQMISRTYHMTYWMHQMIYWTNHGMNTRNIPGNSVTEAIRGSLDLELDGQLATSTGGHLGSPRWALWTWSATSTAGVSHGVSQETREYAGPGICWLLPGCSYLHTLHVVRTTTIVHKSTQT